MKLVLFRRFLKNGLGCGFSGESRGRFLGIRTPLSDLTLVWDWNSCIVRIVYHFLTGWFFFFMKRALHFATKLNYRDIQKCNRFLGTLLWSVRLCSQSNTSRANGDRPSQIERHVVVSVRSNNLPQKCSTVLTEPKFGPPQQKFLDPPRYFWTLAKLHLSN